MCVGGWVGGEGGEDGLPILLSVVIVVFPFYIFFSLKRSEQLLLIILNTN